MIFLLEFVLSINNTNNLCIISMISTTTRQQTTPIPIPILNKNVSAKTISNQSHSYELINNFFDPSRYSPPNEFMNKLKKRIGNSYEIKNVLIREIA